jgi:hypothetical protein
MVNVLGELRSMVKQPFTESSNKTKENDRCCF